MSLEEKLSAGLIRLKLELSQDTHDRLLAYVALLQKWNTVYNLTAVREADKMLSYHLFDCLAVVPHVTRAVTGTTILDVGSGAGLPGIPLALVLPDMHITLLDSNQKKTAFLQQAVIELNLKNVEVICARVEKFPSNQKFSAVISRAFADLSKFVKLAGPLVSPGGVLLAMKGVMVEEFDQLKRGFAGFTRGDVVPLTVPSLKAERALFILKAA